MLGPLCLFWSRTAGVWRGIVLCLGHDEASVHGGGPGHVPTSCSRVCIKQTIQIYLGVGGKRLLGLHRHH